MVIKRADIARAHNNKKKLKKKTHHCAINKPINRLTKSSQIRVNKCDMHKLVDVAAVKCEMNIFNVVTYQMRSAQLLALVGH